VVQEPQRQAESAKEQVVKYEATGGTHNFHAREITTAQWKKAGVEDQKTAARSKCGPPLQREIAREAR
jgi:hypothetical protein